MKKTIGIRSVLALSAIALLWSVPTAQAASKFKRTCLHYQHDDFDPGPTKNGICLVYKNKYSKNS